MVKLVALVLFVGNSPSEPATALSARVVPTIPEVVTGVIVPVDITRPPVMLSPPEATTTPPVIFAPPVVTVRVVNRPVLAVVEPIAPGDANVAPPRVEALIAVLQVMAPEPPEVVQFKALLVVLQLGIAIAVGLAVPAVAFARIVLVACVAKSPRVTKPVAVKDEVTVVPPDMVAPPADTFNPPEEPRPPAPAVTVVPLRVVKAPVEGVPEPIGPGEANVAPPNCAALTAVLQANPVAVVYCKALAEVLHDGKATAVGVAEDAVTFATTVLAA